MRLNNKVIRLIICLMSLPLLPSIGSESIVHDTFKVKNLANAGADYRKFVVLLHEAYDGSENLSTNYTVGTLFASRGSSGAWNVKRVVHINTGSSYISNHGAIVSTDNVNTPCRLVTVAYNGKSYLAIEPSYLASLLPVLRFEGFHKSTGEGLKTVAYYDTQNNVVLNQEIFDSIVPFVSTMTETVDAKKSRFLGDVDVESDLSVLGTLDVSKLYVASDIMADGDFSLSGSFSANSLEDISVNGLSRFYGVGSTMPRFHFKNQSTGSIWQIGTLGGTHKDSFSIGGYSGTSGNITITKEGNVGIGQRTPSTKLEVAGNTKISGDLELGGTFRSSVWRPFGSASDDFYLDVKPGTRVLRTRNWNASSPNIAATGIHTGTGWFASTVGIGTNPSSSPLTINSVDMSRATLSIDESNSSKRAVELWGANTGGQLRVYDDDVLDNYISGTGPTYFQADRSHGVGVGTSSPQALLEVDGQLRVTGLGPVPTSGKGLEMYWAESAGSADIFAFDRDENAMRPLRIRGSKVLLEHGPVGIGVSSPAEKLEVNGTIRSNVWRPFGSASNDFFLDVEPGTRILRTRNWNAANPNIKATGIHTGTGKFEGNVSIGVWSHNNTADSAKLSVGGKIRAEEIVVKLQTDWADYVFEDDYHLRSLEDVEQHIEQNGHLPGIPSANQIEEEGLSIASTQVLMMQKIEELTLYMIEQDKEISRLNAKIDSLEND